uniref:Uncharacterized protein n=1 Tax=Anopheles melas TaxID=34690 RepID=A0A182U6D8_9DIPT
MGLLENNGADAAQKCVGNAKAIDCSGRYKARPVRMMGYRVSLLCMNGWLVHARKCYICGEGADGPFRTLPTHHGQSSVPTVEGTCEDFRPEEKYAFDCPPTYTSCLTQVDDTAR